LKEEGIQLPYYGYSGKLLYIDLTSGNTKTEPLDMTMATKYIGGCGIGERLLCDLLRPSIDPLSPDNPIIICAGPLVGTGTPGAAKIEMLTKSPASANKDHSKHFIPRASGGSRRFGTTMKRAGYDQIIITGHAETPVYLKIVDDEIEICPAEDLWGKKDIYETSDTLTDRHKGSGVIAIGKAGENLIPFSFGWIDKLSHLGRNGGAVVMGSKNLKAVVVHGTRGVNIWDKEKLKTLSTSATREAMKTPRFQMIRSQTTRGIPARLPTQSSYYPEGISEGTLIGRSGCHGCVFACKAIHEIRDGEFAGGWLGPSFHYAMQCSALKIEDYRHAMRLVEMCDRAGIDFRTIVGMLKFVASLYERKAITPKDLDGLELKMGDSKTFFRLLEKIINRDGIGDIMAKGWFALGERFGVDPNTDTDGYQMIKGCSTFFDARTSSLNPVTFAEIVNTKPGAELHPITIMPNRPIESIKEWCSGIAMSPEEISRVFGENDFSTGRLTKHVEDAECVYWALGTCVSWSTGLPQIYSLGKLADLYTAATGIEVSAEELKIKGERIWNTGKLLNTREGINREDDILPGLWAKAMEKPVKKTAGDVMLKDYFGRTVTQAVFEKMLDDYYDEHGWDINKGIPTKNKLIKLGLGELTHLLEV
jgi:aldehyde:ferredoxin oxidoreductase